jgi:hypothetical protein
MTKALSRLETGRRDDCGVPPNKVLSCPPVVCLLTLLLRLLAGLLRLRASCICFDFK